MSKPLTAAEVKQRMYDKLASSGLDRQDCALLRVKALTAAEVGRLPLFEGAPAKAAAQLPYFDYTGKPQPFYRIRYLEETRSAFSKLAGRKELRYVQPAKTASALYWPPQQRWTDWVRTVGNSPGEEPYLIVTEGELKAACACKHGFPTVGLGGVWSFTSKARGVALLPDFDVLPLKGLRVVLLFDSDAATNPDVVKAEQALARRLLERGARPFVARLPALDGLGKTGLDDFLIHRGERALEQEVLEQAYEYDQSRALHDFNTEVVYVRDPGFVFSYANGQRMHPRDFVAHAFANRHYYETVVSATGSKIVKKPLAKGWLEWEHRSELRGVSFSPGEPQLTADGRLNTWTGWGVEPAKGDVGPWHRALEHLFGQSAEASVARQWFERWCAYPLQHPGYKIPSSVLVWGATHGSGKTMIGHALMKLYGSHATEVKDADLEDARFEWAANKQFVVGDDITGQDSRKLANKFKTMISQKELRLNPKYVPSYTVRDCINYYFTSNEPTAFYLEDDDRRNFVWEVRSGKVPVPLRQEFMAWRDEGVKGIAALFHYLLHLDLGDFDPQAEALPTTAKQEMKHLGKSELGAFVERLKESADEVLGTRLRGDFATAEELRVLLDPTHTRSFTANAIARELKRAGFVAPLNGSPLLTSFGVRRVYAVRHPERWVGKVRATYSDAVAHYEEHRAMVKPAAPAAPKYARSKT